MYNTLTNPVRRKEWVSCLVLIDFTFHLIRSSALLARPLPVVKLEAPRGNNLHIDLQSHTREYNATEILKVIHELESDCGKMVFGVVTDNASNMKKAWRLTKEKYPTIICYGWAAQSLSLIFCDMIKLETYKNIIKRAKGVIKEFRHTHAS